MVDRRGSRFAFEVLFLVALAVGLTLAEVRALGIVGVMALGWVIVAALEWAAWRSQPHFGSGLPPRYYVPRVSLPPAQPLEQVNVGYPGSQRDEAPTWIASASLRAEVLGEWPAAGPEARPEPAVEAVEPDSAVIPVRLPEPPPEFRPVVLPPVRRGDGSPVARRGARHRRGLCAPGRATSAARPIDTVMRANVALRELALAAIALLAVVAALAVTQRTRGHTDTTPQPEGSYRTLAGSSGPAVFGRRTACGGVLRSDTVGVAHPTLPCGARIFVTYNGTTVLTQVVDRGPYEQGRQFDLTDALARRLGLRGVQTIEWSYARAR